MNKEKTRRLVAGLPTFDHKVTFLKMLTGNYVNMRANNEIVRRGGVDIYKPSEDEEAIAACLESIDSGDVTAQIPVMVFDLFGQPFNVFIESEIAMAWLAAAERRPSWKVPVVFAGAAYCQPGNAEIDGRDVYGRSEVWRGVDGKILEALRSIGVKSRMKSRSRSLRK